MKHIIRALICVIVCALLAASAFQLGVKHAIEDAKVFCHGDVVEINLNGEVWIHHIR